MLQRTYVDQSQQRQESLQTPITFNVALGATSTAIYTGISARLFMVQRLAIVNPTAGAITASITVGGVQWYTSSVAANTSTRLSIFEMMLIDVSVDIAGSGNGLYCAGWGVRVGGGDKWGL